MSSETLHSTLRLGSIQNIITSSTLSLQNNQFQVNNTFSQFNFMSSLNLLRAIANTRSVSSLSPALSTNANDLNNQQEISTNKSSPNNLVYDLTNRLNTNETFKIGDYVLFESSNKKEANSSDSFNSAFNLKKNKFFYWKVSVELLNFKKTTLNKIFLFKKFEIDTYLKKLEAYYIMENSEFIYNFSEIILEETSNEHTPSHAYVIFEPHYGDLHAYMKIKKRLDESEAKQIFKQCAEAVSECHKNGLVVGDIKLKKFVFVNAERYSVEIFTIEVKFHL